MDYEKEILNNFRLTIDRRRLNYVPPGAGHVHNITPKADRPEYRAITETERLHELYDDNENVRLIGKRSDQDV